MILFKNCYIEDAINNKAKTIMIIPSLQEFCKYFKPQSPILSIDMGEKKMGFAVTDMNKVMAMPLEVLRFDHLKHKIEHIVKLIAKYRPCGIVIGLPLNMNGTESEQTKSVHTFVEKLTSTTDIPIYMQDERMTSSAANALLKFTGMNRKDRHQLDDQVAACLILESVLDGMRNL